MLQFILLLLFQTKNKEMLNVFDCVFSPFVFYIKIEVIILFTYKKFFKLTQSFFKLNFFQ
jgi:hypothetical protein